MASTFNLEDPDHSSLHDFRSEIQNFLSQRLMVKPLEGSLSLEWFRACLELVSISNRAFAKLLLEINYPVRQWGGVAIDEHLNYTLNLLDLLNAVAASVAPLNQYRISISHALSLMETKFMHLSDSSDMAKFLVKFPGGDCSREFQLKGSAGAVAIPGSDDQKEAVIQQGLMLMKKLGFLALGFIVSGLCNTDKPYMEVRKFVGGIDDDSMVRALDLRFCQEMRGIQGGLEEVNPVNRAAEELSMATSTTTCDEPVKELKSRLETLKTTIHGIEKQANDLFSEVLAARDELLDSLRIKANNAP